MNFTSKVLKEEFRALIVRKTQMLGEYARGLRDIAEEIEEDAHKATGDVSAALLVEKITKLDEAYAEQERKLFLDYEVAVENCGKLSLVEVREIHDLALAEVKNKINIAVAFVSDKAKNFLPTAVVINLQGTPKARLDYLAGLTLASQIAEFDDIIKRNFH